MNVSGNKITLYNREILLRTLEMMKKRNYYDNIEELTNKIKTEFVTAKDFLNFVMCPSYKNSVRDILSGMFTHRTVPLIRLLMSFLVKNKDKCHTAIFFVEGRGTSQVSKKIMGMIFSSLVDLENSGITVSEFIIIAQVPLSLDTQQTLRSFKPKYKYQVIKDQNIMCPPDTSILFPTIEVLTKKEIKSIFGISTAPALDKLQKISSNDEIMVSYFGFKPKSVIRIIREQVTSGSIMVTEQTYAIIV